MARTPSLTPQQAAALLGPPFAGWKVTKSNRDIARKFAVASGLRAAEVAKMSNAALGEYYVARYQSTLCEAPVAPETNGKAKSMFDIDGDWIVFEGRDIARFTPGLAATLRARLEDALESVIEGAISQEEHDSEINQIEKDYINKISELEEKIFDLEREKGFEEKYLKQVEETDNLRAHFNEENNKLFEENKRLKESLKLIDILLTENMELRKRLGL